MINIRPVSDLRNKYQEIETAILKEDKNVYLTKNGYGAMVVMSLDKYAKMAGQMQNNKESNFIGNVLLDEISGEEENQQGASHYTSEEFLPKIKRKDEAE